MGSGKREVARLLGMSSNTERQYREALAKVGLLEGPVGEIPELDRVRAALREVLPAKRAPQQMSSIEKWAEAIEAMVNRDAQQQAIYDCLRLEHAEFAGSLSAVKRLVARLGAARCSARCGDSGALGAGGDRPDRLRIRRAAVRRSRRRAAAGVGVRSRPGLQPPSVRARRLRSAHRHLARAPRRGLYRPRRRGRDGGARQSEGRRRAGGLRNRPGPGAQPELLRAGAPLRLQGGSDAATGPPRRRGSSSRG